MSGKKWSEINSTLQTNDADEFLVIQGGTSKRTTKATFMGAVTDIAKFLTITKKLNLDTISDNLTVAFNRLKGLSFATGVPSEADINKKTDHTGSHYPIRYEQDQDIEHSTTAELLASRELITVGNAFKIELALKQVIETELAKMMPLPVNGRMELDAKNPDFIMGVEAGGLAAQMSVTDKETNHQVASMIWNKSSQTFSFALHDKTTGVTKNSFDMLIDGTAKLDNKKIMTEPETEKMIREFRATVTQDIADHAKPTRAEAIATFKLLQHHDFTKEDSWYVKDTSGSKMVLIKYFPNGATDEASAGLFAYEVLSNCK